MKEAMKELIFLFAGYMAGYLAHTPGEVGWRGSLAMAIMFVFGFEIGMCGALKRWNTH